MTNTKQVVTHLREAAEQFLLTADILEGNEGAAGISTNKPHLVGGGGKPGRVLSTAGRRAIANGQKQRWANQRKTA